MIEIIDSDLVIDLTLMMERLRQRLVILSWRKALLRWKWKRYWRLRRERRQIAILRGEKR